MRAAEAKGKKNGARAVARSLLIAVKRNNVSATTACAWPIRASLLEIDHDAAGDGGLPTSRLLASHLYSV